jgi:hypothetical protein
MGYYRAGVAPRPLRGHHIRATDRDSRQMAENDPCISQIMTRDEYSSRCMKDGLSSGSSLIRSRASGHPTIPCLWFRTLTRTALRAQQLLRKTCHRCHPSNCPEGRRLNGTQAVRARLRHNEYPWPILVGNYSSRLARPHPFSDRHVNPPCRSQLCFHHGSTRGEQSVP